MRINTLLCILTLLVFSAAKANNGFEIKTVVIDAGHGGKDPGAIGPGKTYEKNVALSVALKLGEMIKKSYPDVNVIYTRKTDVFLELHERAEIANKNKADLFIASARLGDAIVLCAVDTRAEALTLEADHIHDLTRDQASVHFDGVRVSALKHEGVGAVAVRRQPAVRLRGRVHVWHRCAVGRAPRVGAVAGCGPAG